MKLRTRDADQVNTPRADTKKFTYASGAQPLEGYTIKRGVGRGGFGEVYFATSDAGKEVALKLIRRNMDVEIRGVTQCLNLKHPNLIGLYDIREDDQQDQWVIMEYVSGQALDSTIDRHPNGLPVDQVLWWMHGICAAVAYLHDHGIVHRDLKPGNIFSDEGLVKVGDYGLAKFISCSRRSGQTESVGTVHYMAPEISNGRYGKEIDTYALGIILYELLTGCVPFEGESVGEVLMKHLTAEPELDRLDEPYRDIVRRALAKDPEVRLKSVAEMIDLLPGGPSGSFSEIAIPLTQVTEAESVELEVVEEPRAHAQTDREPIYAAIVDSWEYCERAWDQADLHPLLRAVVLFIVVAGLVTTAGVWLPTLFVGFCLYAVYYAVRGLVVQTGERPAASVRRLHEDHAAAQGHPPQSAHAPRPLHPQRQRRIRRNWHAKVRQELAEKPTRDKCTELLGSMLLAALVALIVSLVAPMVLNLASPAEGVAMQIWFTLVGTLGSWAILIPTKFAEGRIEDQIPMRMMLLALGAAVGAAAWGLENALLVDVPTWANGGGGQHESLVASIFGPQAMNHLAMYTAYFASLFALLRWWRQAEYTRHRRLSVWSVAVCVFWGFCLTLFWPPLQPAGMMIAGVVAVSTQLASPWLPTRERKLRIAEAETADLKVES